jgi:hypothetical protein
VGLTPDFIVGSRPQYLGNYVTFRLGNYANVHTHVRDGHASGFWWWRGYWPARSRTDALVLWMPQCPRGQLPDWAGRFRGLPAGLYGVW